MKLREFCKLKLDIKIKAFYIDGDMTPTKFLLKSNAKLTFGKGTKLSVKSSKC